MGLSEKTLLGVVAFAAAMTLLEERRTISAAAPESQWQMIQVCSYALVRVDIQCIDLPNGALFVRFRR
jgi:intracellular sulfur oxidation DsrE/DsrF family protein